VTTLEHYRLLEPIGKSWSGVVYKAQDVARDVVVALKHFDLPGPPPSLERRTRFRRELELLGAPPHEPRTGLVRVLDQGEEEDCPFVVMEHLEGARTLTVPAGGLPLDVALEAALAAARGLVHAHARGVAHRAVGPDALLVVGGGPPRLSGFGLASLEDVAHVFDAAQGDVDRDGPRRRFHGLAPEQAGLPRPVGPATDVYALGALLVELVSGAPPFPGDDPGAILHGHLARRPQPLRARRPDVPESLERLALACLEKEPAARPTASDVAPALATILAELRGAVSSEGPLIADVAIPQAPGLRPAPAVGRDGPLAALAALVGRAALGVAAGGQGGVALLAGDAGLGKTTLIEAAAALAREAGGFLALGKCPERAPPRPLAPFGEALEGLHALRWSLPPTVREVVIECLEAGCPAALRGIAMPHTQAGAGVAFLPGGDAQRAELYATSVSFVVETAVHLPVLVLAIDDLQWADEGTLELFARLAAAAPKSNVVLLGAYRPRELSPLAREVLARVRAAPEAPLDVALAPLEAEDAERLVAAALGDDGPDAAAVARAVHARVGGNPLHLTQVLSALVDLGALTRGPGGAWGLDPGRLDDAALRAGVGAVVRARAARLGDAASRALSRAAVIGRRFGFDLLVETSGLKPSQALLALERGREAGLVVEDATRAAWNFAHDKVRDALYEALPEAELRALHATIGDALRRDAGEDGLPDAAAELAYHYGRAGDAARALEFHLLAAERAFRAHVLRDAAAHLEAALALIDPDRDPIRFGKTVAAYASARRYAGDYGPLRLLLERALAVAPQDDRHLTVELLGRRAMVAEIGGSPDALQWLQRFAEAAKSIEEPRARTIGEAMLGYHHFDHGDAKKALRHATEALRGVEHLEVDEAANLEAVVGYALARTGKKKEGLERMERVVGQAEAAGLRAVVAWAVTAMGALHMEWGDWSEGLRCYERARPILEATGDAFYMTIARATWAVSRILSGDVEPGIVALEESIAFAQQKGIPTFQHAYRCFLGEATIMAGRADEGVARLREALAGAVRDGDRWIDARARRALAEALALDPASREEAERLAGEALALADDIGHLPEVGRAHAALALALDGRGARDEARAARARARAAYTTCELHLDLAALDEAEARAAAAPAPAVQLAAHDHPPHGPPPAARELLHRRGLKTILAVNRMVGGTLDLDALLDRALRAVVEVLGAEGGLVGLEDDAGLLVVRAARGLGEGEARRLLERPELAPVRDLVKDVRARGRSAGPDRLPGALCVPVGARAVLYVENRLVPDLFGADDVLVLEAIGAQLASGIEAARAYAEIARLKERLERENVYLKEELKTTQAFGEIAGQSPALRRALRRVEQVAPLETTVLLRGETGTGKELFARALHESSPRRAAPLVRVNCSGLTPTLVASELFGHERGAFTGADKRRIGRFELAQGGTLFLDEIGDVPLETQLALLRVLQEREFERVGGSTTLKADVRVIAATNRDLEAAARGGAFRQDLLYRLNGFVVEIPPLRERAGDVPLLARHFALKHARRLGKDIREVSPRALELLEGSPWPGNVRELEHAVERAVILCQGPVLEIEELAASSSSAPAAAGDLVSLAESERRHILAVLEKTGGQIKGETGAARILGVPPSTLTSRMKKLGLDRTEPSPRR
jgi:DNA-binding NtrC family response regulator/tetratricopeptide (TPR) repeat protein